MNNLFIKIFSPLLVLFSAFSPAQAPVQSLAASNSVPTSVALFESSLASKITPTQTSMTLVSGTDKTGTALASSTYAFIIDEGSAVEEMVVADCTGTVCANMVRGISPITGSSTVLALEHEHRRSASVKITDGPQLLILSRIINGIGSYPNKLMYTSEPSFTSGTDIIDKTYADNLSFAGAPDSSATVKGVVETASAAEAAGHAANGSGNTTAPLALTTSIASSTCKTVVTNVLVSSSTTGKLDGSCFDQTYSYTLTGNNTHTGSNTFSGQSNVIASSTQYITNVGTLNATSSIKLNGLSFGTQTLFSGYVGATAATGATSTAYTLVIPANTVKTTNTLVGKAYFAAAPNLQGTNISCDVGYGNGVSTTSAAFVGGTGTSNFQFMSMDFTIMATTTAGQLIHSSGQFENSSATFMRNRTAAVNISAVSYLDFKCAADTGGVMELYNTMVQIIN